MCCWSSAHTHSLERALLIAHGSAKDPRRIMITSLDTAAAVATRFKVSLPAAVIRLVTVDLL